MKKSYYGKMNKKQNVKNVWLKKKLINQIKRMKTMRMLMEKRKQEKVKTKKKANRNKKLKVNNLMLKDS